MTKLKKVTETTEDKQAARRQVIADAALECFLQYGFAKSKQKLTSPLAILT